MTTRRYLANNSATSAGISPVFASSTEKVVLKRDSGVDAVDPKTNVAYLKLVAVDGTLAKTVFRLDTAGGQPPSSVSGLAHVLALTR